MRAMLDPGEEVLLPHAKLCILSAMYNHCADGVPVIVELKHENEFKLTVDDLKDKVTEKTKILVMPFPNNPTGSIMTKEDLEPIAKFVEEHDLFVISDEIYSRIEL